MKRRLRYKKNIKHLARTDPSKLAREPTIVLVIINHQLCFFVPNKLVKLNIISCSSSQRVQRATLANPSDNFTKNVMDKPNIQSRD
jgi:hypothetical protein